MGGSLVAAICRHPTAGTPGTMRWIMMPASDKDNEDTLMKQKRSPCVTDPSQCFRQENREAKAVAIGE